MFEGTFYAPSASQVCTELYFVSWILLVCMLCCNLIRSTRKGELDGLEDLSLRAMK